MIFRFQHGDSPLLISVPHAGLRLSDGLQQRLSHAALALPDTDWQVDRLLETLGRSQASTLVAEYSRVVIDLNRPPNDEPLYVTPGTGLVPTETFAGESLYRPGQEPDASEIGERIRTYWQPYHETLSRVLTEKRAGFGHAVLLDLHSISSRVPRLFEGELPALNLGTHSGLSCAPELEERVCDLLADQGAFDWVVNDRFKGGHITRHYGQPDRQIHALQLEIAQRSYLDESRPQQWLPEHSQPLVSLLGELIDRLSKWRIKG